MKYQFVHLPLQHWNSEEVASLDNVLELTMHYKGDSPFLDIAIHICQTTGIDYAVVAELLPENKKIARTLAFVKADAILKNMEYSLVGTPCENVIGQNICYFPAKVQEQFPTDDFLRYLKIESYLGVALNDKNDNTIGLVALLNSQKMKNPIFLEYLLATVTPFLEDKLTSYRASVQRR